MMGTDPFLWIGDPDPPFITRSFTDPDPNRIADQ